MAPAIRPLCRACATLGGWDPLAISRLPATSLDAGLGVSFICNALRDSISHSDIYCIIPVDKAYVIPPLVFAPGLCLLTLLVACSICLTSLFYFPRYRTVTTDLRAPIVPAPRRFVPPMVLATQLPQMGRVLARLGMED